MYILYRGLWIRTSISLSQIREYLEGRTEARELGIRAPAQYVLLSKAYSTMNSVRHERKDKTNPTESFEQ
jgi:hypothetical protein